MPFQYPPLFETTETAAVRYDGAGHLMSQTLQLEATNSADLQQAADLLRAGRLVAFPTETVYGLGANALSPEAVASIFAAKQRPAWDPVIVHLSSAENIASVTNIPAKLAQRIAILADTFWPGPLTLLLPRNAAIPDAVTAGRELVGVRVPAHPVAHALLNAVGLPIAAPSANLFGHTSPTTAAHVLADLDGRIDAVLDGGPTLIGLESTVLDPTQTPMVLYRPGAITAEQLILATGVGVEVFAPGNVAQANLPSSMPSPGVGIRHYAPRARLQLVSGSAAALQQAFDSATCNTSTASLGILLPEDWTFAGHAAIQQWARWNDHEGLAAAVFSALRALDDCGVSLILCPLPEPGGIADAIRDRLQKAARSV
jgi:L-threonylcarbamoyladenylate synthase